MKSVMPPGYHRSGTYEGALAGLISTCRYDLKLDSAILAEEKHLPLYKELVDNHQVCVFRAIRDWNMQ